MMLSSVPTLHGTPTALLRAMTPDELRQRHAQLQSQYGHYTPANHLDRRFYRTAVAEMTRIRRELAQRGERIEGEKPPRRPPQEWPRVSAGDTVDSEEWGRGEVIRISWVPGEKYGLITIRVLRDGKLRAVHPSTLTLIVESSPSHEKQ